ncbi:hypothetical protein T492DRAFT_972423 [Pavlovales sp. CCMP2436]|nr:hypothetical protein T492DRAFT_972423 [Pavlovales sp. CCMP2436]
MVIREASPAARRARRERRRLHRERNVHGPWLRREQRHLDRGEVPQRRLGGPQREWLSKGHAARTNLARLDQASRPRRPLGQRQRLPAEQRQNRDHRAADLRHPVVRRGTGLHAALEDHSRADGALAPVPCEHTGAPRGHDQAPSRIGWAHYRPPPAGAARSSPQCPS